ncbi:MAG TPA: TonB-dependent siderophore receptor [Trichocoleus sp.]
MSWLSLKLGLLGVLAIASPMTLSPAWAQTVPAESAREEAATTVADWLAQISASNVVITDVQINATATGLDIVLTADQPLPPNTTTVLGNALLIEIPNAVLDLADNDSAQASNPAPGIAYIDVSALDNTVQIAITGTDGPPQATVNAMGNGLTLAIAPGTGIANAEQEAIQVSVTGDQDDGYNPDSAITATRTDTPLRDIPQSIQVVPQAVLEDQQTLRIQDALQNVSGVSKWGNYGGTEAGSFVIRGFTQDGNFRNGFRDNDFYSISEVANIDRIEVLRGPASVLFGQVQPGGIINLVTKQPLSYPFYELGFSAGNYAFYRPTADLSGPLTADGSVRYRLNAAYQNAGSFRDFVNSERFFIAPVVAWDISDSTTLSLDFEYLYDDPLYDRGLIALSDGSVPLPINRFLGYPQFDTYTQRVYRAGYRIEHEFSDSLRLRHAGSLYSAYAGGGRTDSSRLVNDRFVRRTLRVDDFVNENYALQTELISDFTTGTIDHELLVGLELNRRSSVYDQLSAPLPLLDIFNPNYNVPRPTSFPDVYNQRIFTNAIGLYVQDQVDLLDNLKLLVGGRLDFTTQDESYPFSDETNNQSDTAFSPRVGLVYQPTEELSLYASFSQSFLPVVGRSATNSPFVPERGTQYEIGVKGDWLEGQLSGTLSLFHITKRNVLTPDINDPDFSIQVGAQRSQGVELNLTGEILPGWNVIAGYAYTDAVVTQDNDIPVGNSLENVPRHTANLWTTYQIQEGNLQGLGFGLGLFFVGEREGDLPNSNFELPSYLRADAALFYERDNWRAGLNVRNLFDARYLETAQFRNIVYPGAPLSVVGSVSVTF